MNYTQPTDSREFRFDYSRTPAVQRERQAELDAAREAFLRDGNQIIVIPGYIDKPLPRPSYIGTGSRQEIARRRAERELDHRAAPIIHRFRWHGMSRIREALHEAGIGMPPKRVELIAARNGIAIADVVA